MLTTLKTKWKKTESSFSSCLNLLKNWHVDLHFLFCCDSQRGFSFCIASFLSTTHLYPFQMLLSLLGLGNLHVTTTQPQAPSILLQLRGLLSPPPHLFFSSSASSASWSLSEWTVPSVDQEETILCSRLVPYKLYTRGLHALRIFD